MERSSGRSRCDGTARLSAWRWELRYRDPAGRQRVERFEGKNGRKPPADAAERLAQVERQIVPVRLDPELKQAIDARAEAEHRSASEIIRDALRRYLDVA